MADYITTYSKIHFTPLEPQKEQIEILDIAHALSLLSRANGHFPQFYSVAQHSIQCAKEAKARGFEERMVLACLLHDASEAYLSDITRPVKKYMQRYLEVEEVLQDTIYEKYLGSLPTQEEEAQIKDIDNTCLYYEFLHFAGEELAYPKSEQKAKMDVSFRSFDEVEKEFLLLFEECRKRI